MPNVSNKSCNGWCAPTVLYIIFALTGIVSSLFITNRYDEDNNNGNNKIVIFLGHLIITALWTALLFWLCSNCWYGIAWTVLLFPIIVVLLLLIFIVLAKKPSQKRYHNRHLPRADYWSPVL